MKSLILLLFLFNFSLWAQSEKCIKVWSFDVAKNNIIIDTKTQKCEDDLCLRFGSSQKKWLTGFMNQQLESGIFAKPILLNGKAFVGTITGNYRTNTPAFIGTFIQGIKNGNAAYYDEKGMETTVFYDAARHSKFVNPHKEPKPIDDNSRPTVKKPVLYLYPTKKTKINIKLDFEAEQLTHTYPKYNAATGWNVWAEANGDLQNVENGNKYYALFWEGQNKKQFEMKSGFVIKGKETAAFLEEKLAILGLNWRESNEFIMYWLPEMENNNYNLIHFATEEYTNNFPLQISPKPDNLIRIFMVFEPLEKPILLL